MKKNILSALFGMLFPVFVFADAYTVKVNNCDEESVRRALDKAASESRAIITVVECDEETTNVVSKTNETVFYQPSVPYVANTYDCAPKEEVVKREYFVRETVQQYKPVVVYVPSNTYTRVRKTCSNGCEF